MKKTLPLLTRPGGKTRLLAHLLPLITARPHVCYAEIFGGGGALLLAKERSQVEVFNDFDQNLVNAMRIAQRHPHELCRCIPHLNSRADFYDLRDRLTHAPTSFTDVERASAYLFLNKIGFGGDGTSFGLVRMSGGGGRATSAPASAGSSAKSPAASTASSSKASTGNAPSNSTTAPTPSFSLTPPTS